MSEREVSSFWDHLDVLRKVLFRCLIAWAIGATVAFCFKSILFNLLFAPSTDTFISYRGLAWLCEKTGWQSLYPGSFEASFINTELAAQFMTHTGLNKGSWSDTKGYGSSFSYGLAFQKNSANNAMTFKAQGKGIFIVYKANSKDMGTLVINVNGKGSAISGNKQYTWGGPEADLA